MIDYDRLIYKIGSLYVELVAANGAYDGERSIVVKPQNGSTRTLHVYIDGTSIEFCDEPGAVLRFDDVEAGQ